MPRKLTLVTAFVVATGVAAATALVAAPVDAARSSGAAAQRPAPRASLASGLNNPRHLVFRGGTLYVAEAGKGGTRNCETGPEGGTVCFGATGSIMRLGKHPRRILTGLPSIGDQGTGGSALGPSGIVALGGGKLAFTIGGGGTPADRATLPASARRIGTLACVAPRASWNAPAHGRRPDALRGAPRPGRPGSRQRPDRPDPARRATSWPPTPAATTCCGPAAATRSACSRRSATARSRTRSRRATSRCSRCRPPWRSVPAARSSSASSPGSRSRRARRASSGWCRATRRPSGPPA